MFKQALRTFILGLFLIPLTVFIPNTAYARITPDDINKQIRSNFYTNLAKISDPAKKQLVIQADQTLKDINQSVSNRFQVDINKMSAILEEEKSRQGVTKTVVAYGQGSTPLDSAAYYVNYAAEALAYQRAQDYTPNLAGGNYTGSINISANNLKGDLQVLRNKILQAKTQVKRALDNYEK